MGRRVRSELSRYRLTDRFFLALAAIYLVISITRQGLGYSEIFPFSSWSLFSKVPNEVRDYTIRIVEADGRALDRPVDFEDAKEIFGSVAISHGARMSIQRMGVAAERGDSAGAARVRAYLESLYLREHRPVRYEVVARRYDPLERWREGKFRSVRVVATFEAKSPETRP